MAEKTFMLGSVGPFYFDDAEKAWADEDVIDGYDTVSPLQKAVWSDGAIDVTGGTGSELSADYTGALDKMVAALADTPAANGVSFKTDKFTISPPGSETIAPTPIFVVTTRDGNAAIGINGDLIVNGTIYGQAIRAAAEITLNTGGFLKVGASDVTLTSLAGGGGGRLQVWDRTDGGNNRTLMYRGTLAHYNDVDSDTICQVPPRQMAMGYGSHNTMVEINGEFPFVPTVMCNPNMVRLNTTGGTYAAIAHPGPVTKTGADAGRYQFRMYSISCYLNLVFMSYNFTRVYATLSYPTVPSALWWPGSLDTQYQQMTTVAGGIAKLFVQIMFRAKTNSGYGVRGNFQLQVGSLSGGNFVVSNTADNAYESYLDQDWRSVWILCTPSTTGKQYAKVKFTPTAYFASRYEGIGNRIEYYISTAVIYADGWDASYATGSGSYIAYA